MKSLVLAAALFALSGASAKSEVRLPQIISNHAVLQRDQPLHIWGWADGGETVTVTFDGKTASTAADRLGHWSVFLPPHTAGGPLQLTVAASNQIKVDDLLVGDVWFASGQSNMEMPLQGFPGSAVIKDSAAEIAAATHPEMRLLHIPKHASGYPLQEFGDKVQWTLCTPETATKFSAVAYFFGRNVAAAQHVPIGLIDSSWGGTPAEAWTSMDGLAADASLMPTFVAFAKTSQWQTTADEEKKASQREDEAARQAHRPLPRHLWHGDLASWTPAWLFNAMVAPATAYNIKGALWYQGEANTDPVRAPLYARLFPAMIVDWRNHWHEGDFPFFFVQLANYEAGPSDGWPQIREAQRRTLQLINTGMAVTVDVGDPENIHPANKQAVGDRLARAARATTYGEKLAFTGPMFQRASAESTAMRVWFTGAEGALTVKGGSELTGFEVAGDDHKFAQANAKIDGATVLVTSLKVPAPCYVRYGWQSAPSVNLSDAVGLPASPFTSETR